MSELNSLKGYDMAIRPELHRCPSCDGELVVSRYLCPQCGIGIEGQFSRNRLGRLSPEAQDFLIIFVRNRGNIREVEKELNISYPTVRNRLNALIAELGFAESQRYSLQEIAAERMEILRELNEGKISASEAEELLATLHRLQEGSS